MGMGTDSGALLCMHMDMNMNICSAVQRKVSKWRFQQSCNVTAWRIDEEPRP